VWKTTRSPSFGIKNSSRGIATLKIPRRRSLGLKEGFFLGVLNRGSQKKSPLWSEFLLRGRRRANKSAREKKAPIREGKDGSSILIKKEALQREEKRSEPEKKKGLLVAVLILGENSPSVYHESLTGKKRHPFA